MKTRLATTVAARPEQGNASSLLHHGRAVWRRAHPQAVCFFDAWGCCLLSLCSVDVSEIKTMAAISCSVMPVGA
jgi:hypothetical protein